MRHARDGHTRLALTVVVVVVVAMVMVVVVVAMVMVVVMAVIVGMAMGMPDRFTVRRHNVAAAAYRAHQITSKSLIRISSPASGISRPPPQSGHGSSLSWISTVLPQS